MALLFCCLHLESSGSSLDKPGFALIPMVYVLPFTPIFSY